MFHPTVKGSYPEMGLKYGTILFKHGFKVPAQPQEKLDFAKKSETEVRRIFPEALEEIRGFAESCHASYHQTAAFILGVGAFKVEPKCSVFASLNGSDVIFGRNYDFFYSFKNYTESYLTVPKDGYINVGQSDIFIGREDGVNEKGLAVAMTGVAEKRIEPGVSFVLVVRCLQDKCATVKESLAILENTHFSCCSNYLIADKEGTMAVVEAAPGRVKVRMPEDDDSFIVATNHFVHKDMQEMEDLAHRSTSNWDSLVRYSAISEALKKQNGRIAIKTAQEILSDHNGYVCSHQNKIKLGTLWSLAATLKSPSVFRAEGHPCVTTYKPDTRLTKAIQKRRK
jgi:predicted choloylglycine hydrolase